MKHEFTDKVYYADTDAYGVVWHGAYIRWMEKGRVLFCDELGLDLVELKKADIAIPVANLNIKYKSSAKIDERFRVTTTVTKVSPFSVTFRHVISNAESGQIYTDAELVIVAVNNEGKLYRRLPDRLKNIFNEDIICND